jgi:hypothetical protein
MATVTPNARFLTRLLPAILAEAVVLVICVLLYVSTGQIAWIVVAGAAGVVFAAWILILLNRHRDEWRVTDNRRP